MVFDTLCSIIREQLELDESSVTLTMDTDIQEDLSADSLDVVDMIMSLEDEYGIEVPDEDIVNMSTIGDVVRYISEKTGKE